MLRTEIVLFDLDGTITFEDSESGVQAIAAGIRAFGIRHDFNANHNFSLCTGVLESFKNRIAILNMRNAHSAPLNNNSVTLINNLKNARIHSLKRGLNQ